MDEVNLHHLAQTAKVFDVTNKVSIDAGIPTPAKPYDSKNMRLRKRHEKIARGKVIV
jgi:hypothetical protein